MPVYEFAIKKDVLNSGKTIHTPVCRLRSRWGINLFNNKWERITNIYNEFILMELDFTPELSYKDCEIHIKAYQEALTKKIENQLQTVEFHDLEEKEI
jgi:hypothetical protein